jgi:molybdopterin adenylyltransferase
MSERPKTIGFTVMTVSDTRDAVSDRTGPWRRERILAYRSVEHE